ncbi:hypothetical protein L1987_52937 [Smallanthus sonchifolius]|uniref:Uncharacterized protein n=1 Tax=Smallanthus sonchifolius TaxID=185202 RepID=A0ACB9EVQ3_9ASTR|nr:hypothetical protein L1987_52937 [Smallanthus sonchifolius]
MISPDQFFIYSCGTRVCTASKLMECNKEEAMRAKAIAEKKLADKDFTGAKKFTLKSQTLYPELDGISQMLMALNVYIASERKINGESDWYAVLGVKPSDDDETIRKQYRKLVLMLHPDKNKSVGADGAFKIVSEGWGLLSDKCKRSAYNQRIKFQQKVSYQSACSSPSAYPFVNVVQRETSKPKGQNSATTTQNPPAWVPRAQTQAKAKAKAKTQVPPLAKFPPTFPAQAPPPTQAPVPVAHGKDTFWTICHGCKVHYEYYKVYLNQTLLCRSCHKPFHAVEMAAPVNTPKPGGSGHKMNIRSARPEVHFSSPPSGASKAANFANMNRKCEEFNAQRLSKRRKD